MIVEQSFAEKHEGKPFGQLVNSSQYASKVLGSLEQFGVLPQQPGAREPKALQMAPGSPPDAEDDPP